MAVRMVDDGKAAVDEGNFNEALSRGGLRIVNFNPIAEAAAAIWPAIGNSRIDRVQPFLRNRLAVGSQDAADAAQRIYDLRLTIDDLDMRRS